MLSQVDHALTREGVQQALRLRDTTARAEAEGDGDGREFLAPSTRVFSSPLKRAVATTALALGPARGIALLPDASELAYPFAGPDSVGAYTGTRIAEAALESLAVVDPDYAEGAPAHSALLAAVDASAASERWWPGFRESRAAVTERLRRLLGPQLFPFDFGGAAVLVCHSLLIRQVFIDCASEGFAASQPELLAQLRAKKIKNCGVVRAELDPEGRVTAARLAFGSELR